MAGLHTAGVALSVVGLIGVVEFVAIAYAARALADTVAPRLQRRINTPVVRHARVLAAFSVVILVVGLVLLAH